MKKILLFIFLILVLFAGLTATVFYIFKLNNVNIDFAEPRGNPEKTALDFYTWYIDFKGQPIKSGAIQNVAILTDSYKQSLGQLNYDKLLFDPILCAKTKPYKIKVEGSLIENDNAVVTMDQDFYGTPIKTQLNLVYVENMWKIDNIYCIAPKTPEPDLTQKPVVVHFLNLQKQPKPREEKDITCGFVYGVSRTIATNEDNDGNKESEYAQTLVLLFEGPNAPEKAQGYTTNLKPEDFVNFKLIDNTAYVNLSSNLKNNISNSSCDILNLTAQIEETLKYKKEITKVFYAFDGNPTDFYEWSQIGCQIIDGVNNCDTSNW